MDIQLCYSWYLKTQRQLQEQVNFCGRMKKILSLLSLCVLFTLTETLSNDNIVERNRELIFKNKLQPADKKFFGILLVPCMYSFSSWLKKQFWFRYFLEDIICFFAATGIWPHFPQYMQSSVNEMGQQIFSQSDDQIRNFCKGKFSFNAQQAHRPSMLAYLWKKHRD